MLAQIQNCEVLSMVKEHSEVFDQQTSHSGAGTETELRNGLRSTNYTTGESGGETESGISQGLFMRMSQVEIMLGDGITKGSGVEEESGSSPNANDERHKGNSSRWNAEHREYDKLASNMNKKAEARQLDAGVVH